MSYNTQNFQSGQVLTAEALNTMDNQIQANEQAVQGINDTLSNIDARTQEINNTSNNIYNYLQNDIWSKLSEIQNNINNSGGGTTSGGIEEQFQQLGYSMPNCLSQAVQEGLNLRNSWFEGQTWLNLSNPTFMPDGLDLSNCQGIGNNNNILSWRGYNMPNYTNNSLNLTNVMGDVIIGNMGDSPKLINFGPLTESITFNTTFYSQNDYDGQTNLFQGCSILNTINGLSNIDVSNQRSFAYSFSNTSRLYSLSGIESWNTSNAYTMQGMFDNCGVQSLNISNFDTSNVNNMRAMFSGCWNLSELTLPANFGSNADNVDSLFAYAQRLTNLDLSTLNPNASQIERMFCECNQLTTLTLPSGFGANANSIQGFFQNCQNLQTVNGTIDVGNFSSNEWASHIFFNGYNGMGETMTNQIRYIVLQNVGKFDDGNNEFNINAPYWGIDNRQCVIDSLVINSYDRKSNGLSDLTINLYSNAAISFTQSETDQLTNKGYIVNVHTFAQ